VFRRFCPACADRVESASGLNAPLEPRAAYALSGTLIIAGMLMAGFVLLADHVGARGASGFGRYQTLGVVLGLMGILFGALLRIGVLEVISMMVLGLSSASDVLQLRYVPGTGWKEQLAAVMAALLMMAGLMLRRRAAARERPAAPTGIRAEAAGGT
jgi:hypothetical protein